MDDEDIYRNQIDFNNPNKSPDDDENEDFDTDESVNEKTASETKEEGKPQEEPKTNEESKESSAQGKETEASEDQEEPQSKEEEEITEPSKTPEEIQSQEEEEITEPSKTPEETQSQEEEMKTEKTIDRSSDKSEFVAKEESTQKVEDKEIEKDKLAKKKKSKKFPVTGCLIGFVFLYVVSIVLGIFILSVNRDNPAFLESFGFFSSAQLKSSILTAIQYSFFPLTLIFLILTVIGTFIFASAKKNQPEKRKKGLSMMIINVILLFVIIPIWIAIYNYVDSLPVSQEYIKAEILITPSDTSKLIAPVTIDFSLENIQKIYAIRRLAIQKIEWDFDGDKVYEVERPPNETSITYEFDTSGTYNVNVKVTLSNEETPEYTKAIIIQQGTFKAEPSEGPAPLNVTFDATQITTGQNIKQFRWDFDGDNEIDEETKNASVKYIFDKLGDYTIKLQTVDIDNIVKNYSRDIKVLKGEKTNLRAIINVSPGTSGTVPFQVQLDGGDSEVPLDIKIKKYEWNFQDGSPVKSGEKVNHVFKKPGKYKIELTIIDMENNRAKTTSDIIANAPKSAPEAVIETIPPFDPNTKTLNGAEPFEVTFNAENSIDKDNNITLYSWDFDGDGETDTEGSITTYTYREFGIYNATLTVIDADDQKSESTIVIKIQENITEAIVKADPDSGPAPLTVEFDATESTTKDGSKIVSYEWDFGDGVSLPTGAITTHQYKKVGNYRVRLKIASTTGETATIEKIIYVRVVPLQACFEPSRKSGKRPLAVKFDPSCSAGTIKKWSWKFGDGFISDVRMPTHTFKEAGNYTVVLEIIDDKNTVSQYDQVINVQ